VFRYSIGFAIAERLGSEGAKVVISSRKQKNVDSAVEKLKKQGHDVFGLVCHVGNREDRKQLFEKVFIFFFIKGVVSPAYNLVEYHIVRMLSHKISILNFTYALKIVCFVISLVCAYCSVYIYVLVINVIHFDSKIL